MPRKYIHSLLSLTILTFEGGKHPRSSTIIILVDDRANRDLISNSRHLTPDTRKIEIISRESRASRIKRRPCFLKSPNSLRGRKEGKKEGREEGRRRLFQKGRETILFVITERTLSLPIFFFLCWLGERSPSRSRSVEDLPVTICRVPHSTLPKESRDRAVRYDSYTRHSVSPSPPRRREETMLFRRSSSLVIFR